MTDNGVWTLIALYAVVVLLRAVYRAGARDGDTRAAAAEERAARAEMRAHMQEVTSRIRWERLQEAWEIIAELKRLMAAADHEVRRARNTIELLSGHVLARRRPGEGIDIPLDEPTTAAAREGRLLRPASTHAEQVATRREFERIRRLQLAGVDAAAERLIPLYPADDLEGS